MQNCQKSDYQGTGRWREARLQRMLQRFYRQLHEPGDQQRKSVGQKEKQRSAGISPTERGQIRNKAGKVFDRCVLKWLWLPNTCKESHRLYKNEESWIILKSMCW